MNIRPAQPEGQKPGAERLGERGVTPSSRRGSSPEAPSLAPAPVDQVRLSDEARGIQGNLSAEAVPAGELSPARLRQVVERIQSGFYNRPEVMRDTVRALSPAVESSGDPS